MIQQAMQKMHAQKLLENEQFLEQRKKDHIEMLKNKVGERQEKKKEVKVKKLMDQNKDREFKQYMEQYRMDQKEENKKEKDFLDKVDHLYDSPEIKNMLRKYSMHLHAIFDHFAQYQDQHPLPNNQLSLKGFQQFSQQFGIAPHIVNSEAVIQLFNNITKYKEEGDKGFNFEEFQYAVIRLIVRACSAFDLVYRNYGPQAGQNQ